MLSQSKKRHREEMSRLVEQDQQLLRQENERLQTEVRRSREDLLQSREMVSASSQDATPALFPSDRTWNLFQHPKVRQLDASVLALKQQRQQSQSSAATALELENAALKQELEAQKERSSVRGVRRRFRP